jgi:TP901 family phage tail tape measure protein
VAERSVVIRLKGDIADFQSKMRQAGLSAKNALGDELDKIANQRAAMDDLGDKAGKIGVVAAAGFGLAVGAAANFDQAMSNVAATGDDARANIDALREAAREAGRETAFSADEAAAGIENLSKAGVSAADTMNGGLTGALDLAAAGSLEVADAAEIAATAMTQFGLDGEDVPHIADLLAAAAGKAQGEVTDMAAALKYVGPVAAQMGVSIEETTGAIAMLASQGILGDQAGTSLRGMLTALTSPSKQAATEMENLGISMYDANGQFVGLQGIAGQLHDSMTNLGAAERDAALGRIFGNEQITAARILYAGGADAVADWTNQVDDSGFAAETAATKMNNLKGDLEKLRGTLSDTLIGTGEGANGPLRQLVQGLEGAVNGFNNLSPVAKNATLALLGITAVTGGGLWFGTKVVGAIVDTRENLAKLGVTASGARAKLFALRGGAAAIGAVGLSMTELDEKAGLSNAAMGAMAGAVAGPWGAAIGGGVGLMMDFAASNDDFAEAAENARDALEDQALPIEEQRKAVEAAREAFEAYKDEVDNDSFWEGVANQFDPAAIKNAAEGWFGSSEIEEQAAALQELEDDLKSAEEQTIQAADAQVPYKSAIDGTNLAATNQADAIAEATEAMEEQTEAAIAAVDAEYAYAASLLDVEERLDKRKELQRELKAAQRELAEAETPEERDAARERVKALREELEHYRLTLDKNTRAGQENWQVLKNQVEAWNDLPASAQKAKGAYKDAKDELTRTARKFRATDEEVQELWDLLEKPPRPNIVARVDVGAARNDIDNFIANQSGRKITVDVVTNTGDVVLSDGSVVTSERRHRNSNVGKAAGGAIFGPGTGTSDSIPAMLSNGEHVLTAAEVQAAGGHSAIYAWRKAIRGYATGGEVFASRPAPAPAFADGGAVGGSSGRTVPLVQVGTIRHNDMRETERWLREKSQLVGGGGVAF